MPLALQVGFEDAIHHIDVIEDADDVVNFTLMGILGQGADGGKQGVVGPGFVFKQGGKQVLCVHDG